jgi:hypothetical protein
MMYSFVLSDFDSSHILFFDVRYVLCGKMF